MGNKHTPTPWRASSRGDAIVANEPTSQHGDNNAKELQHYGGYVIAESFTDEDRAFALRACNSHDQLVTALTACLKRLVADCADKSCVEIMEARAALTAAGVA